MGDGLRHEEAQPARIGIEPIGWQTEEHRGACVLQSGEGEIRRGGAGDDARAIEKVGVALGRGQHAGRFAIGLAELAIGGARDQATGARAVLHRGEQFGEAGRG